MQQIILHWLKLQANQILNLDSNSLRSSLESTATICNQDQLDTIDMLGDFLTKRGL